MTFHENTDMILRVENILHTSEKYRYKKKAV